MDDFLKFEVMYFRVVLEVILYVNYHFLDFADNYGHRNWLLLQKSFSFMFPLSFKYKVGKTFLMHFVECINC